MRTLLASILALIILTTGTAFGAANEFQSEADAKAHCPKDEVVWVNTESGIYHFHGFRNYGTTKSGAYICKGDAPADGFRAAKNENDPG